MAPIGRQECGLWPETCKRLQTETRSSVRNPNSQWTENIGDKSQALARSLAACFITTITNAQKKRVDESVAEARRRRSSPPPLNSALSETALFALPFPFLHGRRRRPLLPLSASASEAPRPELRVPEPEPPRAELDLDRVGSRREEAWT